MKFSKAITTTFTVFISLIALNVISSGVAARGAQPPGGSSCILNLAANPIACAQRILTRERTRRSGWISAAKGQTLLYVSEPFIGAVSISTVGAKTLSPSGELTFNGELPLSLAVDPSKNLYVALLNPSGAQSIEVFPQGSTKPSKAYTQGITGPLYIAVDSHSMLYVANFVSSNSCNVLEFAKGSMKPTAVITDVPGCPNGVAVDADSNLYVTFIYYPAKGPWQTDVMKYAAGSTKGTRLHLTAAGLNEFYGIAVDAKGNLVIANSQEDGMLGQILIFRRGSRTPSGDIAYGDGWFPLYFALDGERLFAPAYMEQGTTSTMTLGDEPAEFEYPSGRESLVESPKLAGPGFYFGFAISP